MITTLNLSGLREDTARDFLAAIGLLRLIDLKWPGSKPRLSWNIVEGFPRIALQSGLPVDWCQVLVADIQTMELHPDSPLFHGEIIKSDFLDYRKAIKKALAYQAEKHPFAGLPELMFAAYGGQIGDSKAQMIEPTMLSFANGQSGKSLLRDARELIRSWDPDAMVAALAGEGEMLPGKSFRWATKEYRPAAHRAHDPGSKVKGDETMDHPSFNLLAFFGLSCLSTVDTSDGCSTACFSRDEVGWNFCWPIWTHPLSVCEVTAVLAAQGSTIAKMPGIHRLWQSRRLVAEKSVYFAPATLA